MARPVIVTVGSQPFFVASNASANGLFLVDAAMKVTRQPAKATVVSPLLMLQLKCLTHEMNILKKVVRRDDAKPHQDKCTSICPEVCQRNEGIAATAQERELHHEDERHEQRVTPSRSEGATESQAEQRSLLRLCSFLFFQELGRPPSPSCCPLHGTARPNKTGRRCRHRDFRLRLLQFLLRLQALNGTPQEECQRTALCGHSSTAPSLRDRALSWWRLLMSPWRAMRRVKPPPPWWSSVPVRQCATRALHRSHVVRCDARLLTRSSCRRWRPPFSRWATTHCCSHPLNPDAWW